MSRTRACCSCGAALAFTLGGCTIKVEPIRVEPIDITLHIYLEADRKLDEFFGDQSPPVKSPTTQPAKEGAPS